MSCTSVVFRRPGPGDWSRVAAVLPGWSNGCDLRALLPEVFFEHFGATSFVVEFEGEVVGVLIGFLCPSHDDEAYVHVVAVHPAWRRIGLASDLCRRFFACARAHGRTVVRAVASPLDTASIAFHTHLGFSEALGDGVPGAHAPRGEAGDGGRVFLERSLGQDVQP